jgi:hypothetical protein
MSRLRGGLGKTDQGVWGQYAIVPYTVNSPSVLSISPMMADNKLV